MSRSEQIIPEKFRPLVTVKRGHMTTHLPRKFAEVNRKLLASRSNSQEGRG